MKQTNRRGKLYPGVKLLRLLPALLWMGVIFALSSRTGDDLGTILPLFQKLIPWMESFNWGHLAAYFILALTVDYAIGAKADRWSVKLLIVLFCLLYGISDEYHQSFVDGRYSDIADLRNDTIGAALAVLTLKISKIRRFWRKFAN